MTSLSPLHSKSTWELCWNCFFPCCSTAQSSQKSAVTETTPLLQQHSNERSLTGRVTEEVNSSLITVVTSTRFSSVPHQVSSSRPSHPNHLATASDQVVILMSPQQLYSSEKPLVRRVTEEGNSVLTPVVTPTKLSSILHQISSSPPSHPSHLATAEEESPEKDDIQRAAQRKEKQLSPNKQKACPISPAFSDVSSEGDNDIYSAYTKITQDQQEDEDSD